MYTNAQVAAMLATIDNRLSALESAPVPAPAIKPVVGTAEAPLYVAERAACSIAEHTSCSRVFSPTSAGLAAHAACDGKACDNGKHRHA